MLCLGTIVVDTSSSSPFDTRALNEELKTLGISLIDAPVTQTHLHAIRTGDATFMLGCDSPGAIERTMPVFKAMGKYIFPMGASGAGHAMKTLNNYVSVGSIIALCDSLIAGQKFGLDPATMIDVLNVGTGRNFSTAYSMRDEVCFFYLSLDQQFWQANRRRGLREGINQDISLRS
jgi:3-hydroxyisobutyrate dehydrogenase-like beta-hydroxyacid dehydrogenase